ncbi:acyl-CoA dehydrogenase [Streptomyces sp. NPDC005231]|uniref:acyl-CoA dehydrogenase family protein n=1 Tax=Streptomyces sp. NPDC005231 TaxID=3157026 RepID=UPI0033B6AC28
MAEYLGEDPLGDDHASLFAALERAAILDPSLFHGLLVHYLLAMGTLTQLAGDRDDLADHVQQLATMTSIGSFMITEIGSGNSHALSGTESVYDPERGDFVLHTPHPGAQKFPPNAAAAGIHRLAVVFATLRVGGRARGSFPFLVPLRDADGPLPGVRITPLPPTSLMPLDYSVVSFDRVRIPFRNWLRDSATLTPDGSFLDPLTDTERLVRSLSCSPAMWAAIAVGCAAVCRAAVTLAVRHAYRRTVIGQLAPTEPVIRYRNQQRELFGALAATYAITSLADRARRPSATAAPGLQKAGAEGAASPWVAVDSTQALTKVLAAQTAEDVTAVCRRASGALGFFSANRFLDYQGLAHAYRTAGGDSQVILLDAARALVDGNGYEPPPAPPAPEQFDLLDRDLWRSLTANRERLLHERLVEDLRKAAEHGEEPSAAWNDCIPQALELADEHAAGLALAMMLEPAEPQQEGVDLLHALYALIRIDKHAAWYQCEGLLSAEQRLQLPDALTLLCDQLLPIAPSLIDSLGVPPGLLGAPLAADDYRTGFLPDGSNERKDAF